MMALITVSGAEASSTAESPEYWRPRHSDNVSLPNFTFPFAYGQRATDYALDGVSVVVLFIVMISLGCTMEISKIKAYMWNPKGIVVAVVAQYGIMPLMAFALGKVFQLDPAEALAVLICGCCPGGNLSNILSLLSRGDMNLSIVLTTCLTTLALGLMPLLLYLYAKGLYHGDLQGKVPYGGIVASLGLTLVPCAIGVFLKERTPRYAHLCIKAGMIVLLLSSVPIIALSVISGGSSVWTIFTPRLLGTSALMPFLGFSLGYLLAAFFNFSDQCRRTISLETGCQNMQLCFALLKVTFAPDVIGPLFFFPFLYLIFQLGEGLLLVVVFRSSGKRMPPNDSAKQIFTTEDTTDMQTSQPSEPLSSTKA